MELTAPLTINFLLVHLSICLSKFYFDFCKRLFVIVLVCGLRLFATWALSVDLSAQYNN